MPRAPLSSGMFGTRKFVVLKEKPSLYSTVLTFLLKGMVSITKLSRSTSLTTPFGVINNTWTTPTANVVSFIIYIPNTISTLY